MEPLQSNWPRDAAVHAWRMSPEQRDARETSCRASTDRVCRWMTDESDELDFVVVRTWN
jgi:hypothetical protein